MRTIPILLIVALATIAPACGSEESDARTAAPAPLRIGVILPSSAHDVAFSQSMWSSLQAVQAELGGESALQISYSENLFIVRDAAAAMRDYAARGYDIVIVHGLQFAASVREIAPAFPQTTFAYGTDLDTFGLSNVFAYDTAAEEGGYVNGVLAAKLSKRKRIGVIGPADVGDAKTYTEGFIAGVRATDPAVRVDTTWTGSFSDALLMTDAANGHVDSGADVLTGVSQAVVGAINVARARGNVLWFGTQSDQSSLAPELVVASLVYDWTGIVKQMIAKRRAGQLGGESFSLHLSNGGLKIVYGSGYEISADARAAADAAIGEINSGTTIVGH